MKTKEKIIHLLTTTLCLRNCEHCCNKQYDLNQVPYVSEEELKNAEEILITGGEPIMFSNPNAIAKELKTKYHNINKVYLYANVFELTISLQSGVKLDNIDGLSVSIKNNYDYATFELLLEQIKPYENLKSNRVYVFNDLIPNSLGNFEIVERKWQENFVPDQNSIFRKI